FLNFECLFLLLALKNENSNSFDKYTVLSSGILSVSKQATANSKYFKGIVSILATLIIKSLCWTIFLLFILSIEITFRDILLSCIGKNLFSSFDFGKKFFINFHLRKNTLAGDIFSMLFTLSLHDYNVNVFVVIHIPFCSHSHPFL